MSKKLVSLILAALAAVVLSGSLALVSAATVLKVGASPTPHTQILEQIKPLLAKDGITLQVIEFQDYVQPNIALAEGELDANFFQHVPYLNQFCKDRNLDLTSIAKVHVEPLGVYSSKLKSLRQLKEKAIVAIPNDPTNGGRALLLLQRAKLIQLRKDAGLAATELDIAKNPKQLQIKPLEAAQLARSLADVDIAVINTNYALAAKLVPTKDALFIEDKNSPYANILAVRTKDKNNPALQKLAKALNSKIVRDYIVKTYQGSIVPAF
ncbi:D-methionine transport system substrate-binding protein [Hydrogenispora ethanolica]|uniref:Lipoprotein n=1 Tax=Hydrogenispora ethanolica TaxID=1082276 RepID=A0A4R1S2D1_HYDET|nr:MetQ/NlpA family ABC transporter substrate-binding protein [Hydrogenispora ethanolica]TCL73333.1 D-methionine transport system substrate-binding protein [Hydrogenispora ethanolica]